MDRPKEARGAGAFERKLIQIKFAQANGSGRLQPRRHFRVLGGNSARKYLTSRRGANPGRVDVILQRDRHSEERTEPGISASLSIARLGIYQGLGFCKSDEAVQRGIKFPNPRKTQFRQLFR